MGWCLLTPFQLYLFADADVCWYKKETETQNCNISSHRTSLMKLAIGILFLDRPPNLAISWPCFKRMVILSITTYLIPYNYFLPFFSLLGTVAIKWTNSSGKFSINQSIYYESMIENYYSFFSFLSGVNFNASSQALPNSLPVTTPTIRLDCTGT